MFHKIQKQFCRAVGPSPTASLKLVAHCQNVASLSISLYKYFLDIYLNWLNWFLFLILVAAPFVVLIDCMIFFVTNILFPR